MGRKCHDWISVYLDYTAEQESPDRIHFWTALGVISASLRRNVWIDRGTYNLWPNMYICIVANSAKVRKSIAMGMGVSILLEALPNLEFIEDKMSPEGLVKHLNRPVITGAGSAATIGADSTIFIYEDELASLFGYDKSMASRMSILLTKTYGCPPTYMHTTLSGGQIKIYNPCFTILAATAPEGLSTIPADAAGGFLGRVVMVASGARRKTLAWSKKGDPLDRQRLIDDLIEIEKLKGQVAITPGARNFFTLWYERQSKISFKESWLEAFHERCHDTAMKVAILLSVARSDSLIVNEAHIEAATKLIEEIIPDLKAVGVWLSAKDYNQTRAKVMNILDKLKTVARSDIMRSIGVSAREMDDVEKSLEEEGYMTVMQIGNKRIYTVVIPPPGP